MKKILIIIISILSLTIIHTYSSILQNVKILMIVNRFPRISENFILNQIKGLIDEGAIIEIWANSGDETVIQQEIVEKYNLLQLVSYLNHQHRKNYQEIVNSLKEKNYDIVYCQYDRFAPLFAQIKHDHALSYSLIAAVRGGNLIERVMHKQQQYSMLFATADMILPVCNYYAQQLKELGCPEEKIVVHHSAIDCEIFCHKNENEFLQLLTVARLIESKGIGDAIEAIACIFNEYPYFNYTIIGDGDQRTKIEQLIIDFNAHSYINLIGWADHTVVRQYLAKTNLFILPSIQSEGIPNVLMEAMAYNIPIVSTTVGGIPEIVNDGVSGYLVEPGNIQQLKEKILHLMKNKDICNEFAQTCREYILQEHNIVVQNMKLCYLLQHLLEKRESIQLSE